MYLKSFFVKGLAHLSYLIACPETGVCAVIDPKRDIEEYISICRQEGWRLTHIIETHMHADFVSGHLELADETGAKVCVAAAAKVAYPYQPLREGDRISLGTLELRVLETPGHTPESICLAVSDTSRSPEPWVLFTGDTLFVGDVGRPDLFGPEMAKELAAKLYHSLHDKLLRLPDSLEIYPAHGAGSLCGRSIGSKQSSTIGYERRYNYALQPRSREEFIRLMLTDMPEPPTYFLNTSEINRQGPRLLKELAEPQRVSAEEAYGMARRGEAVLLDTRDSLSFGAAHLPGSINVGLQPQFPIWVGNVTSSGERLLLVLREEADLEEARSHLIRIGFDRLEGYLRAEPRAWQEAGLPLASLPQITVQELKDLMERRDDLVVLDVRTEGEWVQGHIRGAVHLPLKRLLQTPPPYRDRPVAVICGSGYRSSIATSILERQGFEQLYNVMGGMAAWREADQELVS